LERKSRTNTEVVKVTETEAVFTPQREAISKLLRMLIDPPAGWIVLYASMEIKKGMEVKITLARSDNNEPNQISSVFRGLASHITSAKSVSIGMGAMFWDYVNKTMSYANGPDAIEDVDRAHMMSVDMFVEHAVMRLSDERCVRIMVGMHLEQ